MSSEHATNLTVYFTSVGTTRVELRDAIKFQQEIVTILVCFVVTNIPFFFKCI